MRSIFALIAFAFVAVAQQPQIGVPVPPLGAGPWVFDTAEQHKIKVSVVTKGVSHPWSLAFLPDGNMLITERSGRLRIVRDGVLDPKPLAGIPKVNAVRNAGLFDVVLHPRFTDNRWVYFTYSKPGEAGLSATTLARGTLGRDGLTDVRDLYSTEYSKDLGGSRIAFGRDGSVYITTGAANGNAAQDLNSAYGKVLRLNDDGSIPKDNPFTGKAGKPEIFSLGHRDHLGLAVHPVTGQLFNVEHGPNGGDELNLIAAGHNYGWPLVSFGRLYEGPRVSDNPYKPEFTLPQTFWTPSIAPSGLMFYTGDKFAAWKGNAFLGGTRKGEIPGTGRLERVFFSDKFEDMRRESLLEDLHQRIRDVRQGPEGFLYVLTDEDDGALLRIEPAN